MLINQLDIEGQSKDHTRNTPDISQYQNPNQVTNYEQ